jgi:putative transposase
VVTVSGKGSGRVSVAGLACYRPGERSRLFYRVRTHRGRKGERRSMSEADYASLITAAHQHLSAPLILIWDNLNTHVSAAMRWFIEAHPDWLTEVRLPAYAPDLNPVEGTWANMKGGMGNLAAHDVDQLTAIIKNRLKSIQYRPACRCAQEVREIGADPELDAMLRRLIAGGDVASDRRRPAALEQHLPWGRPRYSAFTRSHRAAVGTPVDTARHGELQGPGPD